MNKKIVKHADFIATTEEENLLQQVELMLTEIVKSAEDDNLNDGKFYTVNDDEDDYSVSDDDDDIFTMEDMNTAINILTAFRFFGLRYCVKKENEK